MESAIARGPNAQRLSWHGPETDGARRVAGVKSRHAQGLMLTDKD